MSDLLRVLLIDDDEDSAPLTRGMLSRVVGLNFDVEWAPDFEMGLERLLPNAHDVCLVSCDGRDWRGFLGEFVRLKVAAQKEQEMAWQGHLLGRMEFVLCPDRDLMIDAELGTHSLVFWVIPYSRQSTTRCRSSFPQGREIMKTTPVYLGIDVSKRTLHLATTEKFLDKFDNLPAGHEQLIAMVRKFPHAIVVMEASGGYERLVTEALQAAEVPVAVVQPSCVRFFAKSVNMLAKTDKIDARFIAKFGTATQPALTPKTPENTRKLRALSDRRQQVVEDRVREMARLEACADAEVAACIRDSIESLNTVERNLDEQIERLIQTDAEFQKKAQILSSQKGVGQKTVNVLLSHFPELGTLTRGQAAALAGLAPHARESGNWCGRRRIYGGRAAARCALYMAAKTAARWCPVISAFYQRLRQRGKPYNVAIIACARKMLVHLNTQLKPENRKSPPITTIAT